VTDTQFWLALLQIIYVNIILSGDNAVVIALACRSLPSHQQKMGVMFGAGAAVVLRILFTAVIVYLLTVPFLKIAGGLALFWIGYKLMLPQDEGEEVDAASNLFHAIRIVLIADMVMSLDNVIAVAAAAKGDLTLLVLGLLISVPLVVYGATVLIKLINRFPVIVPAGAALIGFIAAEVMVTDPAWHHWLEVNIPWAHNFAPLLGALAVVLVGRVVAPPPAKVNVAGEVLAGAALFGARWLLMRGLAVAALAASVALYAGSNEEAAAGASMSIMDAVRPVLAAVIAIVVGEMVGALARRMRGAAAE
jgi:YjbE family integral membrane protein